MLAVLRACGGMDTTRPPGKTTVAVRRLVQSNRIIESNSQACGIDDVPTMG